MSDVRAAMVVAPASTRSAVSGSFDQFYDENLPALIRLGWALTGSRPVGEELAQEAMLTAHRRWPVISHYDRPDAWVRRVLTNRARSALRRRIAEGRAYRKVRDGASDADSIVEPFPDEALWRAVRTLPPRQVTVIALRYLDARTTAEIAEVMGCSEATVRSHLARAHAALQRRLETRSDDVDR